MGVPFVVYGIGFEFDFPASCHANESALKKYTFLIIDYGDDGILDQITAVRNNKLKHLDTARGTAYEFNSKQGCKDNSDVWRASFGPA